MVGEGCGGRNHVDSVWFVELPLLSAQAKRRVRGSRDLDYSSGEHLLWYVLDSHVDNPFWAQTQGEDNKWKPSERISRYRTEIWRW